mmetsp:Transcript_16197/g.33506  ORF Transcript_16197/g.33506 Transcript_16197/m.33506 type:complete len:212 (-) Transcript_16197:49-684(-)
MLTKQGDSLPEEQPSPPPTKESSTEKSSNKNNQSDDSDDEQEPAILYEESLVEVSCEAPSERRSSTAKSSWKDLKKGIRQSTTLVGKSVQSGARKGARQVKKLAKDASSSQTLRTAALVAVGIGIGVAGTTAVASSGRDTSSNKEETPSNKNNSNNEKNIREESSRPNQTSGHYLYHYQRHEIVTVLYQQCNAQVQAQPQTQQAQGDLKNT